MHAPIRWQIFVSPTLSFVDMKRDRLHYKLYQRGSVIAMRTVRSRMSSNLSLNFILERRKPQSLTGF